MLMNVQESKLENGVRVITSTIPHVQSITFGIWVGVGARYEQDNVAGMSHFVEHLLFKGTGKRSALDISRAIEGSGGHLDAFTQEEATCYYARVAYDQVWKAADVLVDMYLNPRFDQVEIDRERGVIIEEIMMYRDQPQHMVYEMLMKALWKEHPLGRPISGTPETLKGMTRDDIALFKKNKYVPADTVFSFAGKLDHDVCVKNVRRLVGRLPSSPKPAFAPVTPSVGQVAAATQSKDIEQAHLALGFRLFGHNDRRRYQLRILNAALGENMSSRLFQTVREKHGLAYSIHSTFCLFDDSGALLISAGLDRKRTGKAAQLIVGELKKMREKPMGAAELKRAKDYVIGTLRLGLESTTHQMMWLGDNIISYGRFVSPEETIEALSRVTAADVRKLAGEFIESRRATLAMIHPELPAGETEYIKENIAKL